MVRHRPEWWLADGLATVLIDDAGRDVQADPAAADLFGVPAEDIVGSRIGRFTRHEPSDEAGLRAFDVLAREGVLVSTAVVLRPDGSECEIDYRITRSEGVYTMVMRRQDHDASQGSAQGRIARPDPSLR